MVKEVANSDDFNNELKNAGGKLVVADYFATWCGPCNAIAPFYAQLSTKYPNVVFIKVNVEKCQDVAERNNVSAMPTFIYYINQREVDRFRGADKVQLEEKIKAHSATANVATAAAAGADGEKPSDLPNGYVDLISYIQKPQCECLNQSDDHTWENVLTSSKSYLQSDCDEQLLLVISFMQPIKLHSLIIQGPPDNGPKTVKLWINQTRTLDFESAERMEAIQQLDLKPEDIKDNQLINLRFVKFQNVQSLTFFFANNQSGSDTTVINHIKLIGNVVSVTNMNEFKRVAGQPGESHG